MTKKWKDIKHKQRYPKPHWAVYQIVRLSGLVEDMCKHCVGHPNKEWLKKHDPDSKKLKSIHGCDGCCNPERNYNADRDDSK